jgi:hypothetical protein
MLASLESKAKDSLERVIEQKNDLVALKAEVSAVLCASLSQMIADQGGGGGSPARSTLSVSPIYDIVWGMYCVPAPKFFDSQQLSEAEAEAGDGEVFYCRSLVKTREFPLQAYSSEYLPSTAQSQQAATEDLLQSNHLSHLSMVMNKEHLDLARAIDLIASSLPSSASSSMQSIFLKEFTLAELGTLPSQLRAESLRVHTVKDKFTSSWCAEHPPASVSTIPTEETPVDDDDRSSARESRDRSVGPNRSRAESRSFSRPRSRATSRSSRHSQTSLIGRLTSTVLSIFDGEGGQGKFQPLLETVQLESPSGCGMIWEGKALQKVQLQSLPHPLSAD